MRNDLRRGDRRVRLEPGWQLEQRRQELPGAESQQRPPTPVRQVLPAPVRHRPLLATVGQRWPHSLAFLERSLAAASAEAHQQEIAEFSAGVIREERAVENLVLRILARPEEPHEATADYDIVCRLNAREVARERWTTNMQFVFRDVDPYELTTNPIGLTITYYAEDRAVSSGQWHSFNGQTAFV